MFKREARLRKGADHSGSRDRPLWQGLSLPTAEKPKKRLWHVRVFKPRMLRLAYFCFVGVREVIARFFEACEQCSHD